MRGRCRPDWEAVAQLAGAQWGSVTTAQLRDCGCATPERATGRLFPAGHGVYAVGRRPATPHERAMAAVLAGGPHALLSHGWALWLWRLGRLPATPPEVTVPRSRRARPGVHRSARPDPDRTYGIPVTSPARTLNDCAPGLTQRQLRRAVNQAQIAHLTQREALMDQPRLRALVYEHGATRSLLEDLLLELARDLDLPPPALNATVHGVEVDFSYPGLVIEADGYAFHWTKIAFEDDRERRLHLESRGVRVVAVTKRQVTALRATTARQLSAVIAAARRP